MKVGILTHHWLYNFGANLQALATVACLRELGHEPIILNYRVDELVHKYASMVTPQQKKIHEEFCDQWLPETEVCADTREVISAAKNHNIDVAISGSDAVLRLNRGSHREDLSFPNPFWLNWAGEAGVQRTGFLAASSMGSNFLDLKRKQRHEIGQCLEQLSYIGIRDAWTLRMLKFCSSMAELNFCPDPVSVFNDVVNVPDDVPGPADGERYILFGSYKNKVPDQWVKELVLAAHGRDLKVYSLPHPEAVTSGPVDEVLQVPMSPLTWYKWLSQSQGYVGVRFHPIMISIANNKPFVALDQYQNGMRFRNRYISKLINFIPGLRRFSSKTYDVAKRADRLPYCLGPEQYQRISGQRAVELLWEQRDMADSGFCNSAKSIYRSTLKKICGDV